MITDTVLMIHLGIEAHSNTNKCQSFTSKPVNFLQVNPEEVVQEHTETWHAQLEC